jgi:hypothetical protein
MNWTKVSELAQACVATENAVYHRMQQQTAARELDDATEAKLKRYVEPVLARAAHRIARKVMADLRPGTFWHGDMRVFALVNHSNDTACCIAEIKWGNHDGEFKLHQRIGKETDLGRLMRRFQCTLAHNPG